MTTKTAARKSLRRVLAGAEPVPTTAEALADLMRVASFTRTGVLARLVESDELWERACDIKWGTTASHPA
jgi:hypothetical protein